MRKCRSCGAALADDDLFCGECGTKIELDEPVSAKLVEKPESPRLRDRFRSFENNSEYKLKRGVSDKIRGNMDFIKRNLINVWCAAGLFFLYEQLFLGKRSAWSIIPSLVFTPFWLPFSTWAESKNNLKLMPVFYAIWGAACAWTHFRYGGGIACLIGVAIYAAGIIKFSSRFFFRALIVLVAAALAVLVLFMK